MTLAKSFDWKSGGKSRVDRTGWGFSEGVIIKNRFGLTRCEAFESNELHFNSANRTYLNMNMQAFSLMTESWQNWIQIISTVPQTRALWLSRKSSFCPYSVPCFNFSWHSIFLINYIHIPQLNFKKTIHKITTPSLRSKNIHHPLKCVVTIRCEERVQF